MWRRAYLFLILVRLYFALSPSYLHPDENFQGPEVIAGCVFHYPVHLTWEFTSARPIRSVLPLWLVYGMPMYLLRGLYSQSASTVPPAVVYYTLRVLMFILSFVLEDWAVMELVQSPRKRRVAVLLVASSYVTWTWQTHTFSNSIETLVLLWSLVLIARIVDDRQHSSLVASAFLAFLVVLGTFNRVTFPAFILIPALGHLPHFWRNPLTLLMTLLSALGTIYLALLLDTSFYHPDRPLTLLTPLTSPVITPLNNILYNASPSNLAAHGLHPHYTHLLVNLPVLLGPALPLLLLSPRPSRLLYAAACGVAALSLFPHQERRFLMPAVPLVLSSVRLPRGRRAVRCWLGAWLGFNVLAGLVFGLWHQGGVVPGVLWMGTQMPRRQQQQRDAGLPEAGAGAGIATAVFWKTYSPPVWMVDGNATGIDVVDLMGMPGEEMLARLKDVAPCVPGTGGWIGGSRGRSSSDGKVVLVAPYSAVFLDRFVGDGGGGAKVGEIRLTELWEWRRHVNLDDLDFGDDGVLGTLKRVVGRRGLVIWDVERRC